MWWHGNTGNLFPALLLESAIFSMSDGRFSEQVKKFLFTTKSRANGDSQGDTLEILIPEVIIYQICNVKICPVLTLLLGTHD